MLVLFDYHTAGKPTRSVGVWGERDVISPSAWPVVASATPATDSFLGCVCWTSCPCRSVRVLPAWHGERAAWLPELWNDSLVLLECQLFQGDPLLLHRPGPALSAPYQLPLPTELGWSVRSLWLDPGCSVREPTRCFHPQIVELSLSLGVGDSGTQPLPMMTRSQGTVTPIEHK